MPTLVFVNWPHGGAVLSVGPPQWGVRGGGGRNRGQGGRFKGLDPVVPVTDPDILSSISDFYGISPEFPLWEQIITRQSFSTAHNNILLQCNMLNKQQPYWLNYCVCNLPLCL